MDVDLSNRVTADINILYLLWCNIFSLSKFKYVLFPINNFKGPILLGERNENSQRSYLTTETQSVSNRAFNCLSCFQILHWHIKLILPNINLILCKDRPAWRPKFSPWKFTLDNTSAIRTVCVQYAQVAIFQCPLCEASPPGPALQLFSLHLSSNL